MHSENEENQKWVAHQRYTKLKGDLPISANWMETSVQCVIYQGKPLDLSAATRKSHKIPSTEVDQLMVERKVQLVRCQRKIHTKCMRPMISEGYNNHLKNWIENENAHPYHQQNSYDSHWCFYRSKITVKRYTPWCRWHLIHVLSIVCMRIPKVVTRCRNYFSLAEIINALNF